MKDWSAIEAKLKRENKAALIQPIQELAAVSSEAQRYLQTRYGKGKTADQIAPYRKVIQEQFVISEWNNTISWSFAGVQKAIDDYAKSSQGDEVGVAELLVVGLETAIKFADKINLQDYDFDNDIAVLGEKCADHLQSHKYLLPTYKRRLTKVQRMGNALGYEALDDSLDVLINLYR